PRWHAVVNHESGVAHGNRLAHIPDASAKRTFPTLQRQLWQRYATHGHPRLFDGAVAPRLADSAAFAALQPETDRPRALLGQSIEVADNAHGMELTSAPGRNLAVLGTSRAEALSVLDAAAQSLARQFCAGTAEFVLGCAVDSCL